MRKKVSVTIIILGIIVLMGLLLLTVFRWKLQWEPEKYLETNKFLANSERGFYNIRGITISDAQPVSDETYKSIIQEKIDETIELLQIHIGEYKEREISSAGLEQIRKAFEAYAEKENPVRLIVRPLYDWDGKGAESDPSSINIVLRHMEQLGGLMEEYKDQIYIVQGVVVGSWAEMHSSRYLTNDSYQILIRKMHETMPESVFLAVRTPAYWRMAAGRKQPLQQDEAWNMSVLMSRLSLFNDGITGNSLDCGTYGDLREEDAELLSDHWIRSDELDFQEILNLYVPNGGEAVLDNELNDLPKADEALSEMHVSYLNKAHDPDVIEKWKNSVYQGDDPVYRGMSGYDYIERHLGYRFVIRDVSVKESGWRWESCGITVEVENVGYAPRYTPCITELVIKDTEDNTERIIEADTDIRTWRPGETVSFTVNPELKEDGEYEVWIRITGEENGEEILFANDNTTTADGSCYLGTIKKGE